MSSNIPIVHHGSINSIFNTNDFKKEMPQNIVPINRNGVVNTIFNPNDFITTNQKNHPETLPRGSKWYF